MVPEEGGGAKTDLVNSSSSNILIPQSVGYSSFIPFIRRILLKIRV